MSKAKLKRKTSSRARAKSAPKLNRKPRNKVHQSSIWQAEIKALQSKTFTSLEDALEDLVDGVVRRLGAAGPQSIQEREFVRLLLETDPGLLQEITSSIRIRK